MFLITQNFFAFTKASHQSLFCHNIYRHVFIKDVCIWMLGNKDQLVMLMQQFISLELLLHNYKTLTTPPLLHQS